MTQPEIDRLRKELRTKYYGNKSCIPENLIMPKTEEDRLLELKLDIAEMMLSNLIYGGDYFRMVEEDWYVRNTRPGNFDWDKLEGLRVKDGKAYLKDFWEEMKKDFAEHCIVHKDTYTDSEGLSYNSTEWI